MQVLDLVARPATWAETTSTVNGASTATHAAQVNWTHYITGVSVSCSSQPASSVQVFIKDGTHTLDQWEIPAAAFSPLVVSYNRPLRGTMGNAVSVTVDAMGSGVRGTVVMRGFSDV